MQLFLANEIYLIIPLIYCPIILLKNKIELFILLKTEYAIFSKETKALSIIIFMTLKPCCCCPIKKTI